jgi:hypothetical protein
MERSLHKLVEEQTGAEQLFGTIISKESALQALASLAAGGKAAAEGPISVGKMSDLLSDKILKEIASHYHAAFSKEVRSYPYILEDRERE